MFKTKDFLGNRTAIEIQYCKLPTNTSIKKKVSVSKIKSQLEDSLYVIWENASSFLDIYSDIFTNGIYNNLSTGNIDPFGINYYSNEEVKNIIKRLNELKPKCYLVLLKWLESNTFNGIYILGI
ncbi:MAG: hypothetical protein IKC11_00740 [Clostridia bacterium]|nr:hypothetical protein [Clostridia bacterium]